MATASSSSPGAAQALSAAPVPPQNLDAEEMILGACMLSPRAIDATADVVEPADFYRESHGRIYRVILQMHARTEPVDAVTVIDELDRLALLDDTVTAGKITELAALVPAASNAAHYAQIVREMAMLRALIRVGNDIARLGFDRPGETPELLQRARDLVTTIDSRAGVDQLQVETWHEFESKAHDHIPVIVSDLWAEAGFGFIAAPPKKGKTWIALALAIAVATGRPFLDHFQVPEPQPVLYVALEGHRAALRARTGAIARGMRVDPDGHDLDQLRWLYKPQGINLADPAWARRIHQAAQSVGAKLLVVDVLRAAARIKENDQGDFSALRHNLQPITDDGIAIAMLHHFGKLNETQKERTPGERMSGSGAMFGALDVAIYITGSDNGARDLRLDFDARDLAAPEHLHVELAGKGTGPNGGLTYRDTAAFQVVEDDLDEDDVKAPATEIADWVREQGGDVLAKEVRGHFEISDKTLSMRVGRLYQLGVEYVSKPGKPSRLVAAPSADEWLAGNRQTSLDDNTLNHNLTSGVTSGAEGTETPDFGTESRNHAGLPDGPERSGVEDSVPLKPAPLSQNGGTERPEPLRGRAPARTRAHAREDRRTWIETEGWQHDPDTLTTKLIDRGASTPEIAELLELAAAREAEELGMA